MNAIDFVCLDKEPVSLADFDFLELINTSQHSSWVYKGLNKKNGQIVAIKVVNIVDQQDLFDIVRELQKQLLYQSEYTSKLYNCFSQDGKLFIVMEYFAGKSLRNLIDRSGPIEEKYIAPILQYILKALIDLHSKSRLHRDIKCANIMLTADAKIKLSDISPSQKFTETLNKSKSHIIGTPYWLAPETISQSIQSKESDIWQVGITAIEIFQSKPPYHDVPYQKAIFMIVQNEPQFPNNTSREFYQFLQSCLQKDPKKRKPLEELINCEFIKQSKIVLLNDLVDIQLEEFIVRDKGIGLSQQFIHRKTQTSFRIDEKGVLLQNGTEEQEEEQKEKVEQLTEALNEQKLGYEELKKQYKENRKTKIRFNDNIGILDKIN